MKKTSHLENNDIIYIKINSKVLPDSESVLIALGGDCLTRFSIKKVLVISDWPEVK